MPSRSRGSLPALVLALAACVAAPACSRPEAGAAGSGRSAAPRIVVSEIMADPAAVADERGEWIELRNLDDAAVELRGWTLRSANDRPFEIPRSLVVPAGGVVVLARDADEEANGGVRADLAYGAALSLANGTDWLALVTPAGVTADSVAWSRPARGASSGVRDAGLRRPDAGGANWMEQTSTFGRGDRGTPGRANDGAVAPTTATVADAGAPAAPRPPSAGENATPVAHGLVAALTVHVLDVGQGDAMLVRNGRSTVLVDGGPDPRRLGQLLDSLGIRDTTIDLVLLTHPHYDHHSGLRALFESRRRLRVRYFVESLDPYPNAALGELRDSVSARMGRGELVLRDADDPCADGRPLCTFTLDGGARLHVMRPIPRAEGANERSVPAKLVGPDSASFTMWLAGDAELDAIRWFDREGYDERPGMDVDVLKANHHGSCDGVSRRYLALTSPDWAVASLDARNDYGHVHQQTKQALRAAGVPWYRTDQNGTVTITSPGTAGGGYAITPSRGGRSASGPVDRRSGGC